MIMQSVLIQLSVYHPILSSVQIIVLNVHFLVKHALLCFLMVVLLVKQITYFLTDNVYLIVLRGTTRIQQIFVLLVKLIV